MRILNISAQKPDSTGSGVYLTEMVRCELSAGHAAAVVAGVDASDEPTLPEGASRISCASTPRHCRSMCAACPM